MSSESSAVDLEGEVEDARRRMQELSPEEIKRLYGKGFKLLQKSGLRASDGVGAPIRVVVRKPREGLRDDDLANRQTLGEIKTKKEPGKISMTNEDIRGYISELRSLLPSIATYIESHGGSCGLTDIINKVIKVRIPTMTQRFFLIAARLVGTADHGFRITEDEGNIILCKPQAFATRIRCACGASWGSKHEWTNHVFADFEISHQDYHTVLTRRAGEVACLACLRIFTDLVKVVKHCRLLKSDPRHMQFGKVALQTFLGDNTDVKNLLLVAMENGDNDFPWPALQGEAQDPLDEIPFGDIGKLADDGPPTPIHLDDESSDDDAVEVIDVEPDFINLED